MKKAILGSLAATAMLVPVGATAASAQSGGSSSPVITAPSGVASPVGRHTGSAVLPYRGAKPSTLAAGTVPNYSGSIVSAGTTYNYQIVGQNPFVHVANASTTVPAPVLPISIKFDDGSVFNPGAADPTCSPAGKPLTLTMASPIFKTHAYTPGGTNVGTAQYIDAFQRSEFWTAAKPGGANPTYHVNLTGAAKPVFSIVAHGYPTQAAPCGRLGLIDIQTFDGFVQSTILPHYAASTTTIPVILLYNVVLYDGVTGGCCILGYHSAFTSGGNVQTYSISEYDSSAAFNAHDVGVLAHEVGEWANDPFVNNASPSWGHIGQVSGCQANLEVGDPLSGHSVAVTMPNGFTYHPQELAFFSWFYDQSPSTGVNGWFSSNGTFTTFAAEPCH